MRRKMAAGNWKMNGLTAALTEVETLGELHPNPGCDIVICPPATLLAAMAGTGSGIFMGGQDCHAKTKGAHTGDIAADMLKDAGATYVIVGHSERRDGYGESNDMIKTKAQNGWDADLVTIICCGESEAQRDKGETLPHITAQLAGSIPDAATGDNTVIAYEPIWAIGTGRTPTADDIAQVHGSIRKTLTDRFGSEGDKMRILYGGSMNPGNVDEISQIPNVDGGLVGGASLKAADFTKIITALEK